MIDDPLRALAREFEKEFPIRGSAQEYIEVLEAFGREVVALVIQDAIERKLTCPICLEFVGMDPLSPRAQERERCARVAEKTLGTGRAIAAAIRGQG